jgi:hypothetical protein
VPTLTEPGGPARPRSSPRPRLRAIRTVFAGLLLTLGGCGEPSARELKNRQEFEALLTAIALRSTTELEKDSQRLEARHALGELSDKVYKELQEIILKARAGDWSEAEKEAYAFREAKPYFK